MARKLMTRLVPLIVAAVAGLGWAADTAVGPPWISLEVPANPLDPTTRDAVMLVHVYHHEHPAGYRVNGVAEGLVDGERRSVPLRFTETSRPNVYALEQQWPAEGAWVLNIGIEQRALASLLVELGSEGGVRSGSYYEQPIKTLALRSVQVVSGAVSADRIDATLQRLAGRSTD